MTFANDLLDKYIAYATVYIIDCVVVEQMPYLQLVEYQVCV